MSFVVPSPPFDAPAPVFALLLAVVLTAPLLARRLHVPDLVVLLLLGTAIGPTGLGLLERDGAVALLGGGGLLYLMFLAGLELDLDELAATRAASLRFGALTFAVPLLLGTASAVALGFEPAAAVLLGSCWSSHTLLAYPQFRAAGSAGHRAVATSVGATILTDTAALLVLAVVVRAHTGALGPVFWLTLVPALLGLVLAATVGLPRLARRFFAGPGQEPLPRLVFVLLCLFAVAAVTEVTGIEPIVGAFLAGLALNRSVPNGGALLERLELFGGALLVPLFLVATGMLIDLRLLLQPRVLVWGIVFIVTATAGKLLAAVVAGRWLRLGAGSATTMFALSNAQAAATLAAVVVGTEVGILGDGVVDAVVLVVLVTCVTASVVAARVAPRLPADLRPRAVGRTVVVPVANPEAADGLLELAAAFARSDGGVVVPVVVAPTGSAGATVTTGRELLHRVGRRARRAGVEVQPTLRVDTTPAVGIGHAVAEVDASLLVLGWQGHGPTRSARLGGVVDVVLGAVTVPTIVLHDGPARADRVLVVLDGSVTRGRGRPAVALGLRAAAEVARIRRIPVEVHTTFDDAVVTGLAVAALGRPPVVGTGSRAALVGRLARPRDLVVLPTLGDAASLRALATRVLRSVPEGASVLVTVARGVRPDTLLGERPPPRAARGTAVAPPSRRR